MNKHTWESNGMMHAEKMEWSKQPGLQHLTGDCGNSFVELGGEWSWGIISHWRRLSTIL